MTPVSGAPIGGTALFFNGAERVSVSDSPSLNMTAGISIGAWVKAENWNANSVILSKGTGVAYQYLLQAASGYLMFNLNGGFPAPIELTTPLPSAGAWHHVAGTFDGSKIALYLDGTVVTQRVATGSIVSSTNQLNIGAILGPPNPYGFFTGAIGDVRIYNRALTSQEIQFLASPPLITNQPQHAFSLPGGSATFSVGARGQPPLYYQWRFNATNLVTETNFTLIISNVQPANVGIYSVVVSNAVGSVTSSNAFLTIITPGLDDDGNGLLNEQEIQFGTNPLNPDTEGDGLSDHDELIIHATNPLKLDTDGDGMPDDWEVQHGLNPRFNDAADDLDGDGLSNVAEYNWSVSHPNQLTDPRTKYSTGTTVSDFAIVTGTGTNQFFYDRNNRLIGAEFDRGLALAYVYDGNDNLVRQVSMRHDGNANGLPDVWEFLNGLTNNASAFTDTDGDGWTDYQERKAGTNPRDASSVPGTNAVQTAPVAAVLPATNSLGNYGLLTIRLWDAEGNASTPFLQYQISGSTNWQDATLAYLDGASYAPTARVAAPPGGTNHAVVWNALTDLGPGVNTNILLRARARDITLLGDWSTGTPFNIQTTANPDSDGDGMPDWWETQYFGSTAANPNDDPDGDGFKNWQEYIADTNPTNNDSHLSLSVSLLSGRVKLDWLAGSNSWKYLQRAIAVTQTNAAWLNIWTSPPPPSPDSGSYTDLFGTNAMQFYRIKVTR